MIFASSAKNKGIEKISHVALTHGLAMKDRRKSQRWCNLRVHSLDKVAVLLFHFLALNFLCSRKRKLFRNE